ncbi:unnamed protein product [Linum tenue]|uniref:Vacuolar protein sorting-associated protein 52 A n=1 Tax=Linum tenue TaxID=586396 RepID=A0AAV0IUS8_9ROSI|nr:unnamed protein product [Linum tenue]
MDGISVSTPQNPVLNRSPQAITLQELAGLYGHKLKSETFFSPPTSILATTGNTVTDSDSDSDSGGSDHLPLISHRLSILLFNHPGHKIGAEGIVAPADYIKESDNLVSLHEQIRDCHSILSQMETLLSGFQDVQPELEKLRQKAVSKVFDFIIQKLQALRKPKTNIQILQQSVLLKYKYVISFLKEHGKEVYTEVRTAYIDTMNKVLSACFRAYIQALEKLQFDIATSSDLIGVETGSIGLFSRVREPLKNRSAVFALGDRINILKDIEQPTLIPHIAEASSQKYPYEVIFGSLHRLLLDTATSEYLFCDNFFGEEAMFNEIFAGPLTVIDEHFNSILPNSYDAMGDEFPVWTHILTRQALKVRKFKFILRNC